MLTNVEEMGCELWTFQIYPPLSELMVCNTCRVLEWHQGAYDQPWLCCRFFGCTSRQLLNFPPLKVLLPCLSTTLGLVAQPHTQRHMHTHRHAHTHMCTCAHACTHTDTHTHTHETLAFTGCQWFKAKHSSLLLWVKAHTSWASQLR